MEFRSMEIPSKLSEFSINYRSFEKASFGELIGYSLSQSSIELFLIFQRIEIL